MSKAFTKEPDGAEDEEPSGASRLTAAPVRNLITPAGLERLRTELNDLRRVERPKVVETVAWAASNGDRSENGDYIYGKRRLRQIDSRIHFLTERLKIAEPVDPAQQKNRDQVFFGATVTYAPAGATTVALGTTGEAGGQFDASNGNELSLTAGALGFSDLAIVYDRHNTSPVHVQGNGQTNIYGSIYALSSTLYANGNSGNGVTSGSIVVNDLYMNGQLSHLKVTNGLDREWRRPPGVQTAPASRLSCAMAKYGSPGSAHAPAGRSPATTSTAPRTAARNASPKPSRVRISPTAACSAGCAISTMCAPTTQAAG